MATWTGPTESDVDFCGEWLGELPIPLERLPYGPPSEHDDHCNLLTSGRFCDCIASDSSV